MPVSCAASPSRLAAGTPASSFSPIRPPTVPRSLRGVTARPTRGVSSRVHAASAIRCSAARPHDGAEPRGELRPKGDRIVQARSALTPFTAGLSAVMRSRACRRCARSLRPVWVRWTDTMRVWPRLRRTPARPTIAPCEPASEADSVSRSAHVALTRTRTAALRSTAARRRESDRTLTLARETLQPTLLEVAVDAAVLAVAVELTVEEEPPAVPDGGGSALPGGGGAIGSPAHDGDPRSASELCA